MVTRPRSRGPEREGTLGRALGELEQLVLLAVVELGEDAYGAAVGRAIEARTGRDISAGAIYTALDRLEGRGFVSSFTGSPTAERGGRRRKHYRMEPDGARALSRSLDVIRAMSAGLVARVDAMAGGEGA